MTNHDAGPAAAPALQPLAYSVPGAAQALGVSKATVWRLVAAGELRTFKLGARTLIAAGDLLSLIERQLGAEPNPPADAGRAASRTGRDA